MLAPSFLEHRGGYSLMAPAGSSTAASEPVHASVAQWLPLLSASEFLEVLRRPIRSYDSEQDIRNAWKVRQRLLACRLQGFRQRGSSSNFFDGTHNAPLLCSTVMKQQQLRPVQPRALVLPQQHLP